MVQFKGSIKGIGLKTSFEVLSHLVVAICDESAPSLEQVAADGLSTTRRVPDTPLGLALRRDNRGWWMDMRDHDALPSVDYTPQVRTQVLSTLVRLHRDERRVDRLADLDSRARRLLRQLRRGSSSNSHSSDSSTSSSGSVPSSVDPSSIVVEPSDSSQSARSDLSVSDVDSTVDRSTLEFIMADGEVCCSSFSERREGDTLLMLFTALIRGNRVRVMLDSGASGCFISDKAVDRLRLKRVRSERPTVVTVADGSKHTCADHVRVARFTAETRQGTHSEPLNMRVLPIGVRVDVILGGTWLRAHSPVTLDDSGFGSIRFTHRNRTVIIDGCSPGTSPADTVSARSWSFGLVPTEFCIAAMYRREERRHYRRLGRTPASSDASSGGDGEPSPEGGEESPPPYSYLAFALPDVGGLSVSKVVAGDQDPTSVLDLQDYVDTDTDSDPAPPPRRDDVDADIPAELRQQLDALVEEFNDVLVKELPLDSALERPYRATIRLRDDWTGTPPFKRSYRLAAREIAALKEQLDELIAKGYVRPSSSPFGAPVLMVPKPRKPDKLRLVVDYRSLNAITQRDRYPLPDVQQLLDDLQGATVFSTMDALWGFWQIPMEEADIPKTAMCTPFGSYEWLVMAQRAGMRIVHTYPTRLDCSRILRAISPHTALVGRWWCCGHPRQSRVAFR